jgi:Rrf2 family nitric oxide-sensitive transcriptional repressor
VATPVDFVKLKLAVPCYEKPAEIERKNGMISQTAEYALRAVVHLADCSAGGGSDSLQTLEQIATGTKVPSGYLSKVLQQLAKAEIVISQRGLGGGFRLARSPEDMTVYDVVQPVDPIRRIHSCPLKLEAHANGLCPLHASLDAAAAHIEAAFRSTTIAQLSLATEPIYHQLVQTG